MTDKLDAIVNDIKEAINSKDNKQTKAYDTTAEVKRVDYETGTAWVHIPGGVDETPIKLTVNASVGDNVQVRVSGGSAWIVGNASAPPTDDKTAVKARAVATKAQETAEEAQETANSVEGIAQNASTNATTAITLAEGVNEHFWYNQTGVHVTEVTQEEYEQSPSTAGGNVLITSQGMAVRDGEEELAVLSSDEIDFNIGGHNMMKIYKGTNTPLIQNERYSVYSGNSMSIQIPEKPTGSLPLSYDNRFTLDTTYYNSQNASSIVYSGLEIIIEGTPIGASINNFVWLIDSTCSVEGVSYDANSRTLTLSRNGYSTGMVYNISYPTYGASSSYRLGTSLARRGSQGSLSVEEGYYCLALGDYSHAQNKGTIAVEEAQTVIGKYNDALVTNGAFIIGNGTEASRSNAFSIDWDGNVDASGDVTDGSGNVLSDKIDASTLADYIIEEGTQSSWEYRKWKSGKVEAWRKITNSAAAGSVWVSPLYYRDLTISIPSGLFTSAPNVECTSTNSQWWVSYANATSATSLTYRLVKPISSSQASGVSLYLYGE